MTIAERNNKLKHFITCLKCEVSGKCCDDNCPTQYDAGNMGEIIENLEAISKALEQESIFDKIRAEIEQLKLHKAEFLTNDNKVCIDSQAVLDIIDKYKAESEE